MEGHFLVLHSQGSSNIHSIILFLNFGGLSLPRPAIWCCQNIMFGPGLQKDSANLLVFSLLTWSNPCVLGRWSLGRGPKLFTSVTHWFVCLVYVHLVYVYSVTLFFPLQHLPVLISWSSCANQTGAKTNLPCHLNGIKPSISPVWLPKL